MIGQTLDGRYRLLSLLGEGGMGKVFLAEHVVLEKRFAVKVLHEEYSRQEELMRRFQQEAIAASRIGQENIVNVTDFGRTAEGALYFVMEELQGLSIAQLLREQGALPTPRALPILIQICRALVAAHTRGIIHRDLKPENVMLVSREERHDFVKVLDFGISKVGSESHKTKLTRMGVIMGTPDYMAPEQAAAGVVDARADIYSFGVLAYEVLTGTLPFRADTAMAVLLKHQTDIPEPMTKRRPDLAIDPVLEVLVLRCLEKLPANRHSTVNELIVELNILNNSTSGPRPMLGAIPLGAPLPPHATSTPSPAPGNPSGTMRLPGDATPARTPRGTLQLNTNPPLQPADVPRPPPEPGRIGELAPEELASVRRHGMPRWLFVVVPTLLIGAVAAVVLTRPASPEAPGLRVVVAPTPAPRPEVTAPPLPVPSPVVEAPVLAVPVPTAKEVRLTSTPSGAAVFEGKQKLGVTPLAVTLGAGRNATYLFALPGYRRASRRVAAADVSVQVDLTKAPRSPHGKSDFGPSDDLKADPFN